MILQKQNIEKSQEHLLEFFHNQKTAIILYRFELNVDDPAPEDTLGIKDIKKMLVTFQNTAAKTMLNINLDSELAMEGKNTYPGTNDFYVSEREFREQIDDETLAAKGINIVDVLLKVCGSKQPAFLTLKTGDTTRLLEL